MDTQFKLYMDHSKSTTRHSKSIMVIQSIAPHTLLVLRNELFGLICYSLRYDQYDSSTEISRYSWHNQAAKRLLNGRLNNSIDHTICYSIRGSVYLTVAVQLLL